MYIYISDLDIDNAVRTIDLSLEFVHFLFRVSRASCRETNLECSLRTLLKLASIPCSSRSYLYTPFPRFLSMQLLFIYAACYIIVLETKGIVHHDGNPCGVNDRFLFFFFF